MLGLLDSHHLQTAPSRFYLFEGVTILFGSPPDIENIAFNFILLSHITVARPGIVNNETVL